MADSRFSNDVREYQRNQEFLESLRFRWSGIFNSQTHALVSEYADDTRCYAQGRRAGPKFHVDTDGRFGRERTRRFHKQAIQARIKGRAAEPLRAGFHGNFAGNPDALEAAPFAFDGIRGNAKQAQ